MYHFLQRNDFGKESAMRLNNTKLVNQQSPKQLLPPIYPFRYHCVRHRLNAAEEWRRLLKQDPRMEGRGWGGGGGWRGGGGDSYGYIIFCILL